MGISGISLWQILIVLVLAVLLFGSGKIRRLGEDLGEQSVAFAVLCKETERVALQPITPRNPLQSFPK
ncbi:twin-arginine translocase TatA/TatE family subunit [Microbulbifer sp. MLAF003]|uniref:twin-arginine translocase TatA/TatE family subunit n=1 Tax=Microbulbifer sp. MLAF003 TaxID=3032582 RepID=UPI0024AD4672|nr:twin-arginine translocase TatA/TatE family subunit [Microbulbifer sp. MLAF003]WHI53277.1 twin-arginine translocase TatA/TatE family subunit [Microbulbifer sp. MLAF003]